MTNQQPFFCSWSGGKDSTLAFYKAFKEGGKPQKLLTMFEENEKRSRSHALPLAVLEAQAKSLNVPLLIKGASWQSYEGVFLEALAEMKEEGITYGVFGDIDLEDHLTWVENTCEKAGVTPYHPLWKMEREQVLNELLDEGFECIIIVVKDEVLPASFLGKTLTKEVIQELKSYGIDACGEKGEFHTVVVNGPIFNEKIPLAFNGIHKESGYSFLKVSIR
ncbi:diphthine--ammonia ligase [Jeotgalibacillus proteolyticus]|uniref:Adenosine nucleotide hydrolase n=1 Tax=Jeotgalibacillus proteolyticus TaxID=2082395 RepID=A0A2S5GCP5_9BACL|nr:diphthine--ammonia ligase [Jeotgalibacillus proteolyticus]PPA70691.1 adenosine nucleotide hydrolase [Jeotgalibacillus proteolyticus]